jgi:hypothetical protein
MKSAPVISSEIIDAGFLSDQIQYVCKILMVRMKSYEAVEHGSS